MAFSRRRESAAAVMSPPELSDYRSHDRCLAVQQQNRLIRSKAVTSQETVVQRQTAYTAASQRVDELRDAVDLGEASPDTLQAALEARRVAADALEEARADCARLSRLRDSDLRDRIVAAEDAAFVEYQPMYLEAYRRAVERMAPLLLELSAANQELATVTELIGGRMNLPCHPWSELRFSADIAHADASSKLSHWLRELRAAGYLVDEARG